MNPEPGEAVIVFRASAWHGAAHIAPAIALNLILVIVVATRPSWPLALRIAVAGAIAATAIAWFPGKYLRATIAVYPDRFEYVRGDGRREIVRWHEITHMSGSVSFVRLLDMRRPQPVLFGRPILVSRRREFFDRLRMNASSAILISRFACLKLLVRAGIAMERGRR